jgi:hypothetical protein
MTVGLHIAISFDMPSWLEASGLVSWEHWQMFNECLNYSASFGLY